jgi:hypothetical protein
LSARINSIFCILFGLVLIMPMALTLSGKRLTTPLEENRSRQPFPQVSNCDIRRVDECHKQIDVWFNDNYHPRDLLIKLKTQIDYSVFSTSDKVHIGPDNWLYYRSVMDSEKIWPERVPQADFEAMLAEFDALDQYLRDRGIQLIVLPLPLKNVIYPEYVPRSSPNLPQDSRYQQIRKWLAGHESILTVDAYEHLIGRKKDARAYHKTDFHWNDPAGFLYSEKLVNMLWQYQSGESTPLWGETLTVEEKLFSGGQANFLPLLSAPTEQGLFLDVSWVRSKGIHDYDPAGDLWRYIYDGSSDPRGVLGGVVVMGDSYFDAMKRSGFDSYFSSVHRTKAETGKLGEIYANIPEGTRYLVFEFIEVSILGYMLHGLSVPDSE